MYSNSLSNKLVCTIIESITETKSHIPPTQTGVWQNVTSEKKLLLFSSGIICAFNFIKLTPSNLKQLGKCPNKELPKRYLQIHLRIKEMCDPNLKYPNATKFPFFFCFTKFYFALLKEGPHSAIQNNDINNSHVPVPSLFWYYCYLPLCWGKPTALSLLPIWAGKSKSQMADQHWQTAPSLKSRVAMADDRTTLATITVRFKDKLWDYNPVTVTSATITAMKLLQ